jgi:hypothetical protein
MADAESADAEVDGGGDDANEADAEEADAGDEDASLDASPDAEVDAGTCPMPIPACSGVCAATPPVCVGGAWECTGPGFEPVEVSCDGYDNDCDGSVDEGVCSTCAVPVAAIQPNLGSIWDIDFDYSCRTYLTSLISGPDFTRVVSATRRGSRAHVLRQRQPEHGLRAGRSRSDEGSPRRHVRVLPNLQRLRVQRLHAPLTCAPADPGCGCAGQTNFPGFLDAPFLAASLFDTSVSLNGFAVSTPNGLAVGPGDRYYAGN